MTNKLLILFNYALHIKNVLRLDKYHESLRFDLYRIKEHIRNVIQSNSCNLGEQKTLQSIVK